jgi:hypothetical protein
MPEQPLENDSADENSPVEDDEVDDDQEEVYFIKIRYFSFISFVFQDNENEVTPDFTDDDYGADFGDDGK